MEIINEKFNILIVEDDELAGTVINDSLSKQGFATHYFKNAEDAFAFFQENPVDLAIFDFQLPGMSGEKLFEKIRDTDPTLPAIFMTQFSSVDQAVRLLQRGAYTYLAKPIDIKELLHNMHNALENITLRRENKELANRIRERFSFQNYIFNSNRMQQILNDALRSAESEANILLTGETGTGKDVIANMIHNNSGKRQQKFIKINLSTLPETLIEAELFGAEKGAFTGSIQTRIGKFEEADKGTIFLDEIGELSPNIQVKLLRVLQEREVTRIGSNTPRKIDVRIVAATNKNLKKMIQEGRFREDLFYRLHVIHIDLPPLRERREEIPFLIDLFVKKFCKKERKDIQSISKEAMSRLVKYHYPGNIRELENILERAVVLSRGNVLSKEDIPFFIMDAEAIDFSSIGLDKNLTLPERLNLIERKIIKDSLEESNRNQRETARQLGITASGLRYKMKLHGLKTNS